METAASRNADLVQNLEQRGELAVRADYMANPGTYGGLNHGVITQWLLEKDAERQALADAREERMTAAAERSARATWLACAAALASAIAAAWSLFK